MSRKTRQRKNRSIPLHTLVDMAGYGSFPNRGEMIQYLASLKPRPVDVDTVTDLLFPKFGKPREQVTMAKGTGKLTIFGEDLISPMALSQMYDISRLPIYVDGAIMPDGAPNIDGFPVGAVAVYDNAISVAGVGPDIGCSVEISYLDISVSDYLRRKDSIITSLKQISHFGPGKAEFLDGKKRDHEILEDSRWKDIKFLRHWHRTAYEQLGSSGGNNHFIDIVVGEIIENPTMFELPFSVGDEFIALVTHSGSRKLGAMICRNYRDHAVKYTGKIAKGVPRLLSWLDLDSSEGNEYYQCMELAGEYAQANHELIHTHFSKHSGISILQRERNHHNYAWIEDSYVIHRKGATPAKLGNHGIIPGSSGTYTYIVEGLGNQQSIYSSSHGAGRTGGSKKASKEYISHKGSIKNYYENNSISTISVPPAEHYCFYKDIDQVMEYQENICVKTIAKCMPSIVLMGGSADDGD